MFGQDKNINLLHYVCKDQGLAHVFCNLFTVESGAIIDTVPDQYWLFPRTNCLADAILPMVDNENLYLDDHPNLTNEQWQLQKKSVDEFIRPNWAHPNEKGHAAIASMLIKQLTQQ